MDEICKDQLVLKFSTNNFLDEFFQSIKENNWSKYFREVISCFVRLRDDDRREHLEV